MTNEIGKIQKSVTSYEKPSINPELTAKKLNFQTPKAALSLDNINKTNLKIENANISPISNEVSFVTNISAKSLAKAVDNFENVFKTNLKIVGLTNTRWDSDIKPLIAKMTSDPENSDLYVSLINSLSKHFSNTTTSLEARQLMTIGMDLIEKNQFPKENALGNIIAAREQKSSLMRLSGINDTNVTNYRIILGKINSSLNDLIKDPQIKNSLSPEQLNQIKVIVNETAGENANISPENLEKINTFIANIPEDAIKSSERERLKILISNSIKIKNNEQIYTADYKSAAANLSSNAIPKLITALEHIPIDKRSVFTESIIKISQLYKKALDSGNEMQIAMYSTMMQKLMDKIQSGGSGEDIKAIVSEYDNQINILFDPKISDGDKVKSIENYVGRDKFALIKNKLSSQKQGSMRAQGMMRPQGMNSPDESKTLTPGKMPAVSKPDNSANPLNNSPDHNNMTTSEPSDHDLVLGMQAGLSTTNASGEIQTPQPLLSDGEKEELANISAEDISSLMNDFSELRQAIDEFSLANEQLIIAEETLGTFIIETGGNVNINESSNDLDMLEENLKELVEDAINQAIEMEGKLDLSVDSSEANIGNLLEKFRAIITTLDIDTRNNLRKGLEAMLISQKHENHMRDMELRWKSIDKLKLEINKLFDELKEVRQKIA